MPAGRPSDGFLGVETEFTGDIMKTLRLGNILRSPREAAENFTDRRDCLVSTLLPEKWMEEYDNFSYWLALLVAK